MHIFDKGQMNNLANATGLGSLPSILTDKLLCHRKMESLPLFRVPCKARLM